MANKILNTPGGNNQVPAGKVLVGNGYTGDLATFNGKIFVFDVDNIPDPYNPLNLPPKTIRCKFSQDYTPTMGDTQTLVDANENIWDIYKSNTNWSYLFDECNELLEVLSANTSNIEFMTCMFYKCYNLTNIVLFDTKSCLGMYFMFFHCESLINIPPFDFNNQISTISSMFSCCYKVESGILNIYNKMKKLPSNVPHDQTFIFCGRDTTTGAAELAQIPSDWK